MGFGASLLDYAGHSIYIGAAATVAVTEWEDSAIQIIIRQTGEIVLQKIASSSPALTGQILEDEQLRRSIIHYA